jgi:carbamoyltransferase
MKIFSVALNIHDHNTYDGIFHNQIERYSRKKHNIPWHMDVYPHHSETIRMNMGDNKYSQKFYNEYFHLNDNDVLAFTTTIGGLRHLPNHTLPKDALNFIPKNLWDYWYKDNIYYIDHHQSHALYAKIASGFYQSDILAIDGRGLNYNCLFFNKNGKIKNLSHVMGIGELWDNIAKLVGLGTLAAGKLMGLVGYGKYQYEIHTTLDYYFENEFKRPPRFESIISSYDKADVAHTLQYVTEERIKKYVYKLKSCDNLCIAGGVSYNGYMNEAFTKHWKNVYIPPAPGDEGQSLGTYMHADFTLNKNVHIPKTYSGKAYKFDEGDPITPREVGEAIAAGKIVGWFNGKSESGNRALGNRSILADPRNPNIKSIINETIKQREDFRPFAPAVMEQHYQAYFDTNQPSPYMSRIMPVKSDKIPGVTHVDGTARIQTVNRKQNEKFYDVIHGFYQATGIPMVLNTSFNCKEPIVETPEDAIRTFNRTQLDMLVINGRSVRKMG